MEIKTEIKILKALNGLLGEPLNEVKESPKEEFGIMDDANACMVIPKTEESKKILIKWLSKEDNLKEIPELKYVSTIESKCKYSITYLKLILRIMDASEDESVEISVGKDYPSIYENSYFKVILAPRVED